MKNRGVYELSGGTITACPRIAASRAACITLDREAAHLKDKFMLRYAELIYNGFLVQSGTAVCSRR